MNDKEIARELDYNFIALQHQVTELIPQLIFEQSHVFHEVLRKIESGSGPLSFLDVPGGSGKTSRGGTLRQCKLLVWEKSTISHKKSIEALNRTLQDSRDGTNIMGGMMILLTGDFWQTLPVIQRGTAANEIRACIKSSSLWAKVEKFSLKTNMRGHLHNGVDSGHYAKTLLKIGAGYLEADAGRWYFIFQRILNCCRK
ncbi:ATP-dependent DNA helicase [Trichonephila clavipes]|nr:ATP-dependent DNA helicase [Trichonephila clavipes]